MRIWLGGGAWKDVAGITSLSPQRSGECVSGNRYRGGKNVYGRPLGILMLESRFPRIPGDAGNASTWPFPVDFRVVPGAAPSTVVRRLAGSALLDPFVEAALALQADGVSLISTNCGFLVLYQDLIQAKLSVPFVSSSLLQVGWLQSLLPAGRRVGVLTIERASLSAAHWASAGLAADTPVVGLDEVGTHFVDAILGDRDELDVDLARAEHRAAARLLLDRHPEVGAIVLECTNMPPYAHALREELGLPVYDIYSLITWLYAGLRPREFGHPGIS
jgi:Asp/Glu/Hydantoin racemase